MHSEPATRPKKSKLIRGLQKLHKMVTPGENISSYCVYIMIHIPAQSQRQPTRGIVGRTVEDTQLNSSSQGGSEMTKRYCRNESRTSLDSKTVETSKILTGNSSSRSEHSYTGTSDDEMDGGNKCYPGNLPNKPLQDGSPRLRSTSDLASSVGTDALHSKANEHSYTKAQLMQIYAANKDLLLGDNISHDSVYMFGSEGGGSADGDVDINALLLQKIHDLEDDEESKQLPDSPSASQESFIGIQQPPKYSNVHDHVLRYSHTEEHHKQFPREQERERPRYLTSSHRYGSASVFPDYHHHHYHPHRASEHQTHHLSRDMVLSHSSYTPEAHYSPYKTQTEGISREFIPQLYPYLSSSTSSLTN